MVNRRSITPIFSSVKKQNIRIKSRLFILLIAFVVFPPILTIFTTLPAAAATVAGFTPGELSVDQSGGAGYTLPIGIPAGVAGMQPELSINYNSGSGNGLLGVGFSLGGFSSIHRCGATRVQDGFNRGVQLNDNDRFCLDGQRLIAISGAVGVDGTEYRTALDGFSRIISHGQQGSGPHHWTVETKAGQTLEFGNSDDSRVEVLGQKSVRFWAVNQIADAVGNLITYHYHENTSQGEHYADEISYSDVTVKFHYATRPDRQSGFSLGGGIKSSQRLTAIESFVGDQPVKRYNLDYIQGETTGRSLLTRLTECDGDNNCLPATRFEFEQPIKGHNTALVTSDVNGSGRSEADYERHLQDVNGDGRTDLVLIKKSEAEVFVFPGKRDGTLEGIAVHSDPAGSGWTSSAYTRHLLDVDSDGVTDWVMSRKNGSAVSVFTGQGEGSFSTTAITTEITGIARSDSSYEHRFSDINGDGYVDFILLQKSEGRAYVHSGAGDGTFSVTPKVTEVNGSGWSEADFKRHLFDATGDGLVDLVMSGVKQASLHVFAGKRDGSFVTTPMASVIPGRWSSAAHNRRFRDANGDGVTDFVLTSTAEFTANVFLGHGDGSFELSPVNSNPEGSGWTANAHTSEFLDMDGDGIADLVMTSVATATLDIFPGLGNGAFAQSATTVTLSGHHSDSYDRRFGDIQGDGKVDLLLLKRDKAVVKTTRSRYSAERVTAIFDGLGNSTTIEYKPLTDPDVYTKGSGAQAHELDLQAPLYVVSQVSTPDGVGGDKRTNYQYAGLKVHLQGRGSLGFASMVAIDEQTGIVTTTAFRQDYPFTGQVSRTEQRLADSTLLGETTADYSATTPHNDKVYFAYSPQSVEKSYDLDGTLLVTTTTDSLYDDYGNPTQITVTTTDSLGTETKKTLSDYTNDTDLWHLGRLTGATTTHSYSGAQSSITRPSITRTSAFEYNSDGLLSREIIEPDKLIQRKKTATDYDRFGNKIKVTISGFLTPTHSSSSQYSPDGRFPISVTNALGHSESRSYDPLRGTMTGLTGPNGLTTTWKYDSFGRQIREDRPDGTWSTVYRGMCGLTCPDDAPDGTVLYTTTESAGSTPTTTYSNKLGQVTRKVTTGFDGTLVYQDTEYNARGQVSRSSQPYFKNETSHWSQTEYDILGRPTRVTQQGPGGTPIENRFSYSGFTTTVTNAKGHIKTTTKNAQGKVVRVDEEEGGWVTYQYDAIGNLRVTDANGAITTLTYDTLGRHKTAMDDPDMGQWRYQYDIFGNLIKQTDAKGQTVTQNFDPLDRMIKRVEPEGTTTWTYDSAANGMDEETGKSIGKLVKVTAPDGYIKTLGYDRLGRATTVATTADGQTHSITSAYDEFSRVSKVTRPRGFVVKNDYNEQGYLKAIRTPEAQISDYDTLHLSQKWDEIQPRLEEELQAAQAEADQLGAQAAVYRARAAVYYQSAEQLREAAPNKAFLEEDRKQTIVSLQQSAADHNDLADQLEEEAAEYQQVADAILGMMPTEWQQRWFLSAKARYDNYAQEAIRKIESAYQANLAAPRVWIPIQVGNITIFVKGKPGFSGRSAITDKEADHLETIAEWEAGTASLLRQLAADARAQQHARDKFDNAVAKQPASEQAAANAPTPASVLTEEELEAYNAPDYLETDGSALAEYYTQQVEVQQTRQRQIETERTDYARTASRLTQNSVAYSTMVRLLQGGSGEIGEIGEITFWRATGRDAAGRLTSSIVGNGLETQKHYDQATGQLQNIVSSFGSAPATRHLEYQYDSLNSVTSRIDHIQGLSEDFEYDRLDRLTQSYVSGQIGEIPYDSTVDYSYDAQGNILKKSDIGGYFYGDQERTSGNAGPHALLSAGVNHSGYQYDANGSMTSGGGRTIQWTSYNKPRKFTKGSTTVHFKYGPDRQRTRKVAGSTITNYVGNLYEQVKTDETIEHKHFIHADGQLVAMHIKTVERSTWAKLPDRTRYLHRDALGSIDTITDGQGNIAERMSYEPFGARRGGDWRVGTGLPVIPAFTNRGFTGHEHVDEMDLIHMNGRVYDPTLGRFLSADPTMQFPYSSQGYNRYSYVHNNPLKYTDPSGYGLSDIFKVIIAIAAAAIIGPMVGAWVKGMVLANGVAAAYSSVQMLAALSYASTMGAIAGGAAAGFVMGGIMSGSVKGALKGAVFGAISGGMAYGIGHGFGLPKNPFVKAVAHGVSQGAVGAARGGKFKASFLGAFVGHVVGGPIKTMMGKASVAARTTATAIIGGVSAVAGGGKFANGAVSAAFVHLFNAEKGGFWDKARKDFKEWMHDRTNPPLTGKAAAIGVGVDFVVLEWGATGALGIAKYDFDMNGSTDAWGFYWTKSDYVAGADIGVQLEYNIPNKTSSFLGSAKEIGGSYYLLDLSVSAPDGTANELTGTFGAGPGGGLHYAELTTSTFIFWK
ncbi:MAG: FG-GAP-like repeat-containing protein [Candidatus Sedimenticola sp. (ex Thyasira tokunagai)]